MQAGVISFKGGGCYQCLPFGLSSVAKPLRCHQPPPSYFTDEETDPERSPAGPRSGALSPLKQTGVRKGEWLVKTDPPPHRLPPCRLPLHTPSLPLTGPGIRPVAPSNTLPFDKEEGQPLCPGAGFRGVISTSPQRSPTPTSKPVINHKDPPLTPSSEWPEAAPWGGRGSISSSRPRPPALVHGPWLAPDALTWEEGRVPSFPPHT